MDIPKASLIDLVSGVGDRPASEWLDSLADERRLHVLAALEEASTPIDERELARIVAAREEGTSPDGASEELVERVHISLYHNHLPKLADMDVIEYDHEEAVIADSAIEPGSVPS